MRLAALAGKLYGLSRMSHSVLDIPYLAVGAVIALGAFPPGRVMILGLLAAFAGITAIFALNDLIDRRVDSEKMAALGGRAAGFDLDSLGLRHPLAQGKLSLASGAIWVVFWGAVSFTAAWLVRPTCAWLVLAAALLEVGYCSLLKVTPWKTCLTGANVAVGGLAGVYAATGAPHALLVVLFFAWCFGWESGCRNTANDWTDYEEDVRMGIRTVPVTLGLKGAARISLVMMVFTVACAAVFPFVSPHLSLPIYEAVTAVAAGYLLVIPSIRWQRDLTRERALVFFNRACFYPLSVFVAVAAALLL